MSIDVDEHAMGRVLRLPVTSVPGETAALRAEVVAALHTRRAALVDSMCAEVRGAGLAGLLEAGGVALERRLDHAVRITLGAWEHGRPLHADEVDELRALGAAVARAGVPLWRLLHAAQVAARAGWDGVAAQALAVVEEAGRPRFAARVVAELALAAMDMLGRVETMLTLGYSDVLPPRRLVALEPLRG